jgi:hypothetical protein
MALPALFHECSIAANIIGVPPTILSFILNPGSIDFLLLLINTPKVILMARSPLLVGLTFSLSAAFQSAAGCLLFFAARVRNEQTYTIRAPLLLWHKGFSSPGFYLVWTISDDLRALGTAGRKEEREWRRKREKLFSFLNHWN